MNKTLVLLALFGIIFTGCSNISAEIDNATENIVNEINEDTRFIFLTFIDEEFLLKIAQYKGGNVEDKAYTMMVVVNRVLSDEQPYEKYLEHTMTTVQDEVLRELYGVDKLTPFQFEQIMPDEDAFKALEMIKQGFDNTNGSLEYKD